METVELEWRLIYAMIVAGKSAKFANAAVARLRRYAAPAASPIAFLSLFSGFLETARVGRYTLIARGLRFLREARIDLRTCSPAELEAVPGIGPKTSRFFIVWTRPDARVAVLDRHVLRWMRENGHPDAPEGTPMGRRYADLERAFLAEADRRGLTPRELDLEIWGAVATAPNVA
jgi:hypothetical protein